MLAPGEGLGAPQRQRPLATEAAKRKKEKLVKGSLAAADNRERGNQADQGQYDGEAR
jgi:hypothetical protein